MQRFHPASILTHLPAVRVFRIVDRLMPEFSWYADASLTEEGHVYCAGPLAQCVRRWKRLSDDQKINAVIKLKTSTDQQVLIGREELERLALNPQVDRA